MMSSVEVSSPDESSLVESIDEISKLRARREMRELRNSRLSEIVGSAKGRVARQPKAQEFLEKLQEITHQKTVGLYEELLSAVVQDVLPGPKNVSLELKTLRGLPSLDIEMVTDDGNRESVLEGSGGALTNILSAGLRVIALSRSGAYPFLVLDEPDCWLKPSKVPQFANVISQIANDLKIQVLLISHHDSELFSKFSSQVRLAKRGGVLEAQWASEDVPNWEGATTGLKELALTNFMSHKKTVIPLSPGVTCLTGENDIGKSAIVAGFRALFYGASKDYSIAHGETEFEVAATFFDDSRISLVRYAKKSPKQRWRLFVKGVEAPVQDSSPKDGVPDWVSHVANMARTDDLDIAFSNQKSPVFLLNESPSRQASILAIGRESAHLQKLISKNKERNGIDAKLIRDGENEGASIARELIVLADVDNLGAHAGGLKNDAMQLKDQLSDLGNFESKINRFHLLTNALSADMSNLAILKEVELLTVDQLRSSIARLSFATALAEIDVPSALDSSIELDSHDDLSRKIKTLEKNNKLSVIVAPSEVRFDAEIYPIVDLLSKLSRLEKSGVFSNIVVPAYTLESPVMLDFDSFDEKCRRLARALSCLSLPGLDSVASAPSIPLLEPVDKFSLSIELCKALSGDLLVLAKRGEGCVVRQRKNDARLQDIAKEGSHQCPTCGGELDWRQFKNVKCSHD